MEGGGVVHIWERITEPVLNSSDSHIVNSLITLGKDLAGVISLFASASAFADLLPGGQKRYILLTYLKIYMYMQE